MALRPAGTLHGGPAAPAVGAVIFQHILDILRLCRQQHLTVSAVQLPIQKAQKALLVEIFVICLIAAEALRLIHRAPLEHYRADGYLRVRRAVRGLGEHSLDKLRQHALKLLSQYAHRLTPRKGA